MTCSNVAALNTFNFKFVQAPCCASCTQLSNIDNKVNACWTLKSCLYILPQRSAAEVKHTMLDPRQSTKFPEGKFQNRPCERGVRRAAKG